MEKEDVMTFDSSRKPVFSVGKSGAQKATDFVHMSNCSKSLHQGEGISSTLVEILCSRTVFWAFPQVPEAEARRRLAQVLAVILGVGVLVFIGFRGWLNR
ncbi:hypothetical protein [Kyrpidia spormannii]|uniref:hypothetical protein n=1 Tax=Kyrpidia spormannii TaxID=2055160 RepID=UPI001472A671|nr:hypothetical protein [Kyrpidia spormannii]